MLPAHISTRDPQTGNELPVPPSFLDRVRRATELLSEELQLLHGKVDVAAEWRFVRAADDSIEVVLDLSSFENVRSTGWRFKPSDLADDETALRNLRQPISKLSLLSLSAASARIDVIQRQLRHDLETLLALPEE